MENKNVENQFLVSNFLRKWIVNHTDLVNLSLNAPLVQPILPLSKSLSDLSQQVLLVLENKQVVNPALLNDLLKQCSSKDHADVELAVYNSLKKLTGV